MSGNCRNDVADWRNEPVGRPMNVKLNQIAAVSQTTCLGSTGYEQSNRGPSVHGLVAGVHNSSGIRLVRLVHLIRGLGIEDRGALQLPGLPGPRIWRKAVPLLTYLVPERRQIVPNATCHRHR